MPEEPKVQDAEVIVKGAGTALTRPSDADRLLDMISAAQERGITPEALEKYQAMWERARDDARNAAIISALVAFQSEVPPVPKNATGQYGPYADLPQIERTIRPDLKRNRLAYRWTSEPDGTGMVVFCHIMHADGGEKVAKARLPGDEGNRGQKPYLATGGVLTYGKRQTLIEVLGLTTCDADAAPPTISEDLITEEQAANLRALMQEVGETEERFCKYGRIEKVEDLTADRFAGAVRTLEKRRS